MAADEVKIDVQPDARAAIATQQLDSIEYYLSLDEDAKQAARAALRTRISTAIYLIHPADLALLEMMIRAGQISLTQLQVNSADDVDAAAVSLLTLATCVADDGMTSDMAAPLREAAKSFANTWLSFSDAMSFGWGAWSRHYVMAAISAGGDGTSLDEATVAELSDRAAAGICRIVVGLASSYFANDKDAISRMLSANLTGFLADLAKENIIVNSTNTAQLIATGGN